MEHILVDPALEAQPNFESAAYVGWLNALVAGGIAREDALEQMAEGWRLERQEHILLWQQQNEEDTCTLQEQLERERAEKEVEEQLERRKAEKKKPKINDFDDGAVVADVIIPRPSQYAIQKIKNMEYVELWYFSPDGCHEASTTSRSTSDSNDAFGFTKVDGIVALKMIVSFKASQKALQDHDLSWQQFNLAKTSFLVHIKKNNWPQKHQQALVLFFMLITNHEHRMRLRGEKALLHYVGFVCCEWHDRLVQDQGFNIGLFNNALYNSISGRPNEMRVSKWCVVHYPPTFDH
ncbi:uncharacterized protein BJ212DRAFT_1295809 [Suillus subaureus]|uniref:Uncharacterized protein n=1 Tax=Suillus subaureus TaxID=48587 RepID=A0A9P7JIT0_9AGAM|nr:uncharacterized protein BJ212DRAFT_1295809 [Suillus subaureus]KAG1824697.1 hypothetical protein BJ212DRAFT_1295809 [Suillus subaureus]